MSIYYKSIKRKSAHVSPAVLVLAFNRPEATSQLMKKIKLANLRRVYVAVDGPRVGVRRDVQVINEVQSIVMSFSSEFDLHTKFRKRNHGCKIAVVDAISWFFRNEPYGIILEDDCMPHLEFFRFCEQNLIAFRSSPSIWAVSGFVPISIRLPKKPVFHSSYFGVWGWATWADRWEKYDLNLIQTSADRRVTNSKMFGVQKFFWSEKFYDPNILKHDSWAYQFSFLIQQNNGIVIKPTVNLIKNVGIGHGATHTDVRTGNNEIWQGACKVDWAARSDRTHQVDRLIDLLMFLRRFWRGLAYYIRVRYLV